MLANHANARRWGWLMAIALCVFMVSSPALAWWNSQWPYRMKITADTTPTGANIAGPIGRTQILVRLFAGNFNFNTAKPDGSDIRLVAGDDKTPLHYHVEKWDPNTDQVALIWVDVTDLAPNAQNIFYVYWGNNDANEGEDAHATYDASQTLVYHFDEEAGVPKDSTAFSDDAQTGGKRDSSGLVGYGLRLDGTAPAQIKQTPNLAIAANASATWSLWFKPDAGASSAVLFADKGTSGSIAFGYNDDTPYLEIGSQHVDAAGSFATGSWHNITVVAGDNVTLYLDGKKTAAQINGKLPAIDGAPQLGGDGNTNFKGLIDEFQISKTARSEGQVMAQVLSVGPDAKLLSFAQAEQTGGGNTFLFIIKSVTLDAWVVIGLLGVMMLITWAVMVNKALYLRAFNKANRAYRQIYKNALKEHHGDHRGALIKVAHSRSKLVHASPLWRLASSMASELEHQQGLMAKPKGALTAPAIAALRAVADTGLSEESRQLGSLMVMLTIAISGGPFLGLLGTVVGVMITFASIAMAGDVNVNAIAPGIAAALLATVAGLAVAIPSLFAYNYFLIQIRDANIALSHQVEETLVRIADMVRTPRSPDQQPLAAE